MKKTAHNISLIIVFFALIVLTACSISSEPYGPLGNSNGNISNGGMSVRSSNWIYFMNYGDNNALYRLNTDDFTEEKISEDQGFYLNIFGNELIYCNASENNHLYRMNLESLKAEPVIEDMSANVLVSDDWIYYISRNESENEAKYSRIFRIRSDGSNREQLSEEPAAAFNISGNIIFYLNLNDQSLAMIRTDGTGQSKISDIPMNYITVYEDELYYIDGENTLWKMNHDGTKNIQLSEDKTAAFNISDGWIYYATSINDSPELEIRRMDLDGKDRITFNDDNAVSINIHEDWLVYLGLDFTSFQFTQTFVKSDGTGRRDFTASAETPLETLTYDMNEKVSTDKITLQCISAYATNILENKAPGYESPIFDEVTDGAYVFIHTVITNDTEYPMDLFQEIGILEDLDAENWSIYWPFFADITDEEKKNEIGFFLPRDRFMESLTIPPHETRDIQIYIELYEAKFPVYLGLFSGDGLNPVAAIILNLSDEDYVVSWEDSMEIMADAFPESEISQLNGMGYQLPDEKEEHFYYTFEVKEEASGEPSYYFVRRDNALVYTGEVMEENPDYIAVPVKPLH